MTADAAHPFTEEIRQAAHLIRKAKNGVVLTGAGISTPSGIPDFRSSPTGLWSQYDPFKVASLTTFRTSPERFFAWIHPLATKILAAEPNPAHTALADLQDAGFITTIITQNIDGLHQQAGSSSVIEVHGSLDYLVCIACYEQVEADENIIQPYLGHGQMPHCPKCGGILKPNVVLMEEQLPFQPWLDAVAASKSCDLMLVAGSSLQVMPVAGLPMRALEGNSSIIVVNHHPTYIDVRANVVIHGDVADVLPRIVREAVHG